MLRVTATAVQIPKSQESEAPHTHTLGQGLRGVVPFSYCERKGQDRAIDRGRQNKYPHTHTHIQGHTHTHSDSSAGQGSAKDTATWKECLFWTDTLMQTVVTYGLLEKCLSHSRANQTHYFF